MGRTVGPENKGNYSPAIPFTENTTCVSSRSYRLDVNVEFSIPHLRPDNRFNYPWQNAQQSGLVRCSVCHVLETRIRTGFEVDMPISEPDKI